MKESISDLLRKDEKISNLFILLPPVGDDEIGGFFHPTKSEGFGPMPDPIDDPEEFDLNALENPKA